MKTTTMIAAGLLSVAGLAAPAQAGFYFEGLAPFTDPPNCNDPYATTCGRYGQVPHAEDGASKPHYLGEVPPAADGEPREPADAPAVRLRTREGLEK